MSPALHSTAHHIVEPMDLKVSHRHLHITYSSMKHSDKTFMGMTTSGKNAEDVMAMCEILFGKRCDGGDAGHHRQLQRQLAAGLGRDDAVGDARLREAEPAGPVLALRPWRGEHARLGRPAVAQLNAEALSALAYTQVIRKGAPAIYGHYLSTVSMKSGAPMAGTPEISLMNFMIGQMARFYNVPWRTSNLLGGAKTFDAQAGYESAMTMNAVLHAGANYIWHSAGWNEAGMHCSIAKFVVDAEMCQMGYRMAEGPRWDDFDEAMQAVRDVGPGGHYLGHPHTLENFERAFFMPKLFDNNSIEQWQAEGRSRSPGARWTGQGSLLATMRNRSWTRASTRRSRLHRPPRTRNPAVDELNTEH
jgi:trimethylamine--corrinoid protein Co-methyltransferase